jgi:outer membrane cobalamin receptor
MKNNDSSTNFMGKKFIFFGIMLLFQQFTFAQYTFTAIVRDSSNQEPLVGVSVVEKGTKNGTLSDIEGKVKLNFIEKGKKELTVEFSGYKTLTINEEIPQKEMFPEIFLVSENNVLNEITVSSVRTNSAIENIPTKIEVLGLEEVNEENGINPGNIKSLLSDVAGIQMQQVSVSSGNTYARIQGLNWRYTQILKDGLPLFSGMAGGFGILQIPPSDLKQIEIIKGCGSTLYGADAIGGIINLISKNPTKKQEISFTANETSLSETNLNVYAAKKYGKFGYTLFLGQTFQKQKDIDNDGFSDVPNVNNTVIHPELFFFLNPKSILTLNYSVTFDRRKGGEMSYFSSNADDSMYHILNSSQRQSADVKWLYEFSKKSNLTVKFSTGLLNENLSTKYYNFSASQNIYYSEISYYKSLKKTDWVAGLNFNGDIFKNQSSELSQIENYDFRTLGFFVQNIWKIFDKMSVESGFREDYHFQYGFFVLPRLSIMYKLTKDFTARINSGFGYKIPNQISYIEPETDLRNIIKTDLKPELSQGINGDINFRHFFNNEFNITINQSFFLTNISKPIYDSSSIFAKPILVNASKPLITKGLQTYIRLNIDETELYLGYVYTNVKQNYDPVHSTPFVTPKHQYESTLVLEFSDDFRVGFEFSYIADQLDQNYKHVKNYVITAAMLQYNIKRFTFVLNGENLLDVRQSKYEQIYDGTVSNPEFHKLWAPIEGRVINLSVRWQL